MVYTGNPAHPQWCLGGADCVAGWHTSRLHLVVPHGGEVINVGAGLWRLDTDTGPFSAGGVVLELSVGEEIEQ
ncbi:MAG TPA: hypothetical protein VFX60_06120 [Micromonospora sp.]|nr:hypothetical protein [Micromonospora sp.]